MHLIDQMQDDGDPFIIDAEVLTQITNELRARQIDVREHQLRLGLRWHEPAGFDPSLQHMVFNAGPNQKFLGGDHSNLQMPARILVLSRLPASCEFLEFRIELLRQYDLDGHVFVPVTLIATQRALAPESQHSTCVRAFGDGHTHRARRRGNIKLCSEHCFRQTDRQLEVDIVALSGEELVRLYLDLNQRVPGWSAAESRPALPT